MQEVPVAEGIRTPWNALRSLCITSVWLDRHWDHEELNNEDAPYFFPALEHLPSVTSLQLYFPTTRHFAEVPTDTLSGRIYVPTKVLNGLKSLTISCDREGPHVVRMMEHAINVEELAIMTGGMGLNYFCDARYEPLMSRLSKSRLHFPRLEVLRLVGARNVHLLDFIKTPELLELDLSFTDTHLYSESYNIHPLPNVARRIPFFETPSSPPHPQLAH